MVGLMPKAFINERAWIKSENILDHMGSTELAANLFRATQTEEKLKRENIKGKQKANQTHYEVGKKVRKTIQEIGGAMPENLPVANSIKKLDKKDETKKLKKKKSWTMIQHKCPYWPVFNRTLPSTVYQIHRSKPGIACINEVILRAYNFHP